MTRPVRYSEIYTKQDRLPYSDTEVIHQVTGLSQEFHRVSPPLVKQSWRRWVTSEWHPPITKASRYFRSAIESKEVGLKRRDESVIMVPRIIKICASHYHTCDHLEVDGENAWKSYWKAFGCWEVSCFHFSFIHFASLAISQFRHRMASCCTKSSKFVEGFHECKRMKTFFQCLQLTQISSQPVSISRTNLPAISNTWSWFDRHVKVTLLKSDWNK